MKITPIGFLFLYLNTVLASPSALQSENIEYEAHSRCYAGWVVKLPSDNPTKVKFNFPDTTIFEYKVRRVDGTSIREDYEGNKVELEEVDVSCFKNEGSQIISKKIKDSQELSPGAETLVYLGRDSKKTYEILYKDDYPIYFKKIIGKVMTQFGSYLCGDMTGYSYEGELGHIKEKFFSKISQKLECLRVRKENYEGESIKSILFFGEDEGRGYIEREDLMLWSRTIPTHRLCIRRGYGDREYGNKYIEKMKGDIQKGILYGIVSKKEMNANNRKGQFYADAYENDFSELMMTQCKRVQNDISRFKMKYTEDPY